MLFYFIKYPYNKYRSRISQTLMADSRPTKKKCHFFIFSIERYILWEFKAIKKIWFAWQHFCLWYLKVLQNFGKICSEMGHGLRFLDFFFLGYYHPLGVSKMVEKNFWVASSKKAGRTKTVFAFFKWPKTAARNY